VTLEKTNGRDPSASSVRAMPARPTTFQILARWLPVLLWLVVIFTFSGDAGSTRRTSRIIGPILRWLNPNVSAETINNVQFVARKTAHVIEYAVLVLLVWRGLRQTPRTNLRPWSWRDATVALAVAVAFAVTDEWHQTFVRDRQGQASDVAIDSAGALFGLGALWTFGRRQRKW
jgi:VanZ family protein